MFYMNLLINSSVCYERKKNISSVHLSIILHQNIHKHNAYVDYIVQHKISGKEENKRK